MANVYVVTYNHTFKYDTLVGEQTSLGRVGKGDIFTFSNKEKAIKFVEDKIKEEENSKFGCPKYVRYDYNDMWVFSQNEFNSNNTKHEWLIIKSKIN
jgi:hypothetical protein